MRGIVLARVDTGAILFGENLGLLQVFVVIDV
jgi:hypothetical protein